MSARIALGCLALFSLAVGCATVTPKPKIQLGQHPQTLEKKITKTVSCKYLLYLPKEYDNTQTPWPMILFLHGAGERGNNLDLVKKHGPPKLVEQGKDFPFVIVSPQCPSDQWWPTDALIPLIDHLMATHRIDPDRVYVTGLSMGGFGTWDLATAYPDRFAAIAPICGRGQTYLARRISHLPVWAFHGAKDNVVPLEESEKMVSALKKAGADVKLTVYPDAGHDSWTETYDNPALYEWFLGHKRQATGRGPGAATQVKTQKAK